MTRRFLYYFFFCLVSLAGFLTLVTSDKVIAVPEAAAQSPINVALASQGTTIRYYEYLNPLNNGSDPLAPHPCRTQFPTSAIIDGDRKGLNFGNGGVFSTCDEQYVVPAPGNGAPFINTGPIVIDFNQLRTINQINLFTAQDNLYNPVDPTTSMTFTNEGTPDFIISYWNPTGKIWTNIQPSTDWQNNYKVWKFGTFGNITTTKIRINFYMNRVPPSHKFRITEIEAIHANSNHGDFGTQFMTNQALIVGNGSPALASYLFFPSWPWGTNGWPGGNAPIDGEYYPLAFSFNNIPSGMSFSYPGYRNYDGNDPCLHVEDFVLPSCLNNSNGQSKYQANGFSLYGNTNPGTYYFTMTATEQLETGVTRPPYSHTYTFRLDVLGADIKANGQGTSTNITSGTAATIDWSSFTDPDPAGYTGSGAPACNVSPTGWTGLTGSQSTGPLTSQTTYAVTCSFSGVSVNDSVIVRMKPPPPTNVEAFNTATDSGVGCGSIKVTWDQPGGNYEHYLYRDGGFLAALSNPSTDTYIDVPPSGGSPYSYAVASFDGTALSDVVTATPSSIVPTACTGTLSSSDIDVTQVNSAGTVNSLCSGETEIPETILFKEGDVVRFRINLCNSGTQLAQQISFSGTLTNLFNPRNFSTVGCNPVVSSTSNTITLSNVGDIAPNGACALLFDATVQTLGTIDYVNRFDIVGTIYSGSIAANQIRTPPLPYFNISRVPQRYESAP